MDSIALGRLHDYVTVTVPVIVAESLHGEE
jgi:hypothetical protein